MKRKKAKIPKVRNFVAKYMPLVTSPKVERDRTKFKRHKKHKNQEE